MSEVIVVHGYAGSGKTTQCERIATEGFNESTVQHISIGKRLRAIRLGAAASRFYEDIISRPRDSDLPDDIANGIVFESLEETEEADLVLIDGYPRRARTVGLFHDSLQEGGHELLGTVFLRISEQTSIDRVLERGEREGEELKGESLQEDAERRYPRDAQTVHRAINALGAIAPVERIDANGEEDEVYVRFKAALGRLALQKANL